MATPRYEALRLMLIQAVENDYAGRPEALNMFAGALGTLLDAHQQGRNAIICVDETFRILECEQRSLCIQPPDDPEEIVTDHGQKATNEPPKAA